MSTSITFNTGNDPARQTPDERTVDVVEVQVVPAVTFGDEDEPLSSVDQRDQIGVQIRNPADPLDEGLLGFLEDGADHAGPRVHGQELQPLVIAAHIVEKQLRSIWEPADHEQVAIRVVRELRFDLRAGHDVDDVELGEWHASAGLGGRPVIRFLVLLQIVDDRQHVDVAIVAFQHPDPGAVRRPLRTDASVVQIANPPFEVLDAVGGDRHLAPVIRRTHVNVEVPLAQQPAAIRGGDLEDIGGAEQVLLADETRCRARALDRRGLCELPQLVAGERHHVVLAGNRKPDGQFAIQEREGLERQPSVWRFVAKNSADRRAQPRRVEQLGLHPGRGVEFVDDRVVRRPFDIPEAAVSHPPWADDAPLHSRPHLLGAPIRGLAPGGSHRYGRDLPIVALARSLQRRAP